MSNVFIPYHTNAMAVAAVSISRSLPDTAENAVIYNDGPNVVFIHIGDDNVNASLPELSTNVGADGNGTPVPVGARVNLQVRPGSTKWAAICRAAETASVYCTSGNGE